MDGLFLLVGLTYLPVTGLYGPAITTAGRAAFMQSGYTGEFEVVTQAAERKVPAVLRHTAIVYSVVSKQEFTWKGHTIDGAIGSKGASFLLHVEF